MLTSQSLPYTHFVNIPLNLGDIPDAARAFRAAVLSSPWAEECRVEQDIFFEPGHLHLTLAMLKLYSDERRHKAKLLVDEVGAAVRAILSEDISGRGIRVAVKGLEYMNDDPSEVDVLYVQVNELGVEAESGGKLARVCKAVVDIYGAAGLLLERDDRPVKLHATLMNTRLRRSANKEAAAVSGGTRVSFDAKKIFEEHKDLDFGEWDLEAVHLSKRGEFDVSLGGFYRCIAQCPLAL